MSAEEKPWRPSMPPETRERLDAFEEEREEGDPLVEPAYFDRDGEPMSLADWAEAAEDFGYRLVAEDVVGDLKVMTIWVGLDQGVGLDGEPSPLIFETTVFDQSEEGLRERREGTQRPEGVKPDSLGADRYMDQYATEGDALKGHAETVLAAKAGLIRKGEN